MGAPEFLFSGEEIPIPINLLRSVESVDVRAGY